MIKAVVARSVKRAKEALHGREDIPHPIMRVTIIHPDHVDLERMTHLNDDEILWIDE